MTLLDEALNVIATHEREAPIDTAPDECRLMKAVTLESHVGLEAAS